MCPGCVKNPLVRLAQTLTFCFPMYGYQSQCRPLDTIIHYQKMKAAGWISKLSTRRNAYGPSLLQRNQFCSSSQSSSRKHWEQPGSSNKGPSCRSWASFMLRNFRPLSTASAFLPPAWGPQPSGDCETPPVQNEEAGNQPSSSSPSKKSLYTSCVWRKKISCNGLSRNQFFTFVQS